MLFNLVSVDYRHRGDSEGRYHALFQANPDALVVADLDGKITEVNTALEQLVGAPEKDLLGKEVTTLFDEPEKAQEGFEKLLADGAVRDFSIRMLGSNGETTTVFFNATLLRGADGEPVGALGVARDLTELRHMEKELEETHRRLRAHLDNSPVGVMEWDGELRVLGWSAGAERIFGWSAGEVVGKVMGRDFKFIYEDDVSRVSSVVERVLSGEKRVSFENRNYRKDGSVINCEWQNSVLHEERGHVSSVMSLALDITKRKRLEADLRRLADHDSLTGLLNRRAFMERLDGALAQLQRYPSAVRQKLGVLYLDLNGFKEVNDLYGHAAGDELLRQAAGRLSDTLREGDTLARLGGDEFAAILEPIGDAVESQEGARLVAERVRHMFEKPFIVCRDNHSVTVGASVGFAVAEAGEGAEELLRRADQQMYQSKIIRKGQHNERYEGD